MTVREIGAMEGPQYDFVMSEALHPGYIGGVGSGKTYASVLKTFSYAMQHPRSYGCHTVPVLRGVDEYFLPTAREVFGEGEGVMWVWQDKKSRVYFPEVGSTVFVRSALEPIVGMNLHFFSMDEAGQDDQEQTFYSLQFRLRAKDYPLQGWLTTTPNLTRPWIKLLYQDRFHPQTQRTISERDYPRFRAFTDKNVNLPSERLAQYKADWEGTRFGKMMLEGEFIAVEGLAFPDLSDIHFRDPPNDKHFRKYHVGFDPGAVSPTALVVIGEDESRKLWVLSEFYQRNATEYDWITWLREQGFDSVIGDPTGISERQRSEWMKTFGVRIKPARFKEFDRRYRAWLSRLAIKEDGNPGIYISNSCPNLRRELENLAFAKPKGYSDPVDHWVPGSLDHAYDAAAYAIMEYDSQAYGSPPRFKVSYQGVAV